MTETKKETCITWLNDLLLKLQDERTANRGLSGIIPTPVIDCHIMHLEKAISVLERINSKRIGDCIKKNADLTFMYPDSIAIINSQCFSELTDLIVRDLLGGVR